MTLEGSDVTSSFVGEIVSGTTTLGTTSVVVVVEVTVGSVETFTFSSGGSNVDLDGSTVDVFTNLLQSIFDTGSFFEFNVTETSALAISLGNTGIDDTTARSEESLKSVCVSSERKVTDEDSLGFFING